MHARGRGSDSEKDERMKTEPRDSVKLRAGLVRGGVGGGGDARGDARQHPPPEEGDGGEGGGAA